jgi:inorganic triphosphatase YgiF
MGDHLEIEQKFEVDDDFARPDFGSIPGVSAAVPVTYHLAAVYYDTPDTRLAAAKITLRRRTGGTDEGWHLKLPVSIDERRELHAPLSGPEEVPERLASRVAEVARGVPVTPIATLDTERTVVTLTANASPVAEIADDVVTARRLTSTGQVMRWREIEVEVPERSPDLQEAAARLLFAAGARPAGKASKLARLLDG